MANRTFLQFSYSLRNRPIHLDCNFIIDRTNASGITDLKGPGIANVFMNTSTTPTAGSPNPAQGTAVIFLQDNYRQLLELQASFNAPLTGAALTSGLTVGQAYTILSLGSSTLAQFQTAGLPRGLTPTIGQTFIALATSIAGGATVQASGSAQAVNVEVIGDADLTISNALVSQTSVGPYLVFKFTAPQALSFTATTATDTSLTAIAAADAAKLRPGMAITGPGIADGTTIVSVSTTSAVLSQATTASATITAVALGVMDAIQPPNGTKCRLNLYLTDSSVRSKGE